MFQGMQENQLRGALEALLFVTDEPVGTIVLADMLEVQPADVERELVALRSRFEQENRGVQLREVAGGWRLSTHPVYHDLIEKYVLSWDTRKLSQAAMETLAIVAYSQPVTRGGVASIRGVNSDSSINSLVEKGLVREAGVADTPGNPVLYATTRGFLEKFGLRSVSDLPNLDQFAPDDATRELIRERLSATREPLYIADEARLSEGEQDTDGFDGLRFDFDDEGEASLPFSPDSSSPVQGNTSRREITTADKVTSVPQGASEEAHTLLAQAMASSFGLVEKIDFDSLSFETDDE